MVRSAHSVLGRNDLAEEAAQEAIMQYLDRSCEPQAGSEGAYLRRMSRNFALMSVRRANTEDRVMQRCVELHPSAETEVLARLASVDLRTLISELPEQQQRVILQRHLCGASVAQVAAELRVSTGTVKTHCYRARNALKQGLDLVA